MVTKKYLKAVQVQLLGFMIMMFAMTFAFLYHSTKSMPLWAIILFMALGGFSFMLGNYRQAKYDTEEKRTPNK